MSTVTAEQRSEIVSIKRAKADKFLDRLSRHPFIAIIVDGEDVHFYARGDLDADHLAQIKETIEHMTESE